ncbi:unnamed protein product [Leptosia nina]|uniref:Galactokinase n=1 Tax=Leptosia nina TaxID=320188 RepID=A0AAV1J7G4_9NEOP
MTSNGCKKNEDVPVQSIPFNNRRIDNLKKYFCETFGNEPSFFVRVPGRVNIIGEHIDYCGYPVLPMALEQDIIVAASLTTDSYLYLRNMNNKYVDFDIDIKSYENIDIKPDLNGKPFWYNYVLCGIKGGLEYLNSANTIGLQLLIDGNIPPASGLSSSSALVSAACLTFLYAQNASLNKREIATLCAKSERYIGTQGGGMDQAIAFLAEENCAQYITWNPLNATPVALPKNASFVVAHSLAEANKAATNDYNRRVIECRLAARILINSSSSASNLKVITLSQAQKILGKTLSEMINLVHELLPKEVYSKSEICNILNVNEIELNNLYLTQNTTHLTEFKLKQRALHVFGEASRVEDFRKVCMQSAVSEKRHSNGSNGIAKHDDDTVSTLGKLMTKSHESLRDMFECSHKNLDYLVDVSRNMDIHCRLTGAGWGGCVVALCPNDKVDEYINMLQDEFYVKYCNIEKNEVNAYVFATKPNYGAIIYA